MKKKLIAMIMLGVMTVNGTIAMGTENKFLDEQYKEYKSKIQVFNEKFKELEERETIEDSNIKALSREEMEKKPQERAEVKASNITLGKQYKITSASSNNGKKVSSQFTIPKDGLVTINYKRITDNKNLNHDLELTSIDGKQKYIQGIKSGKNVTYKIYLKAGTYKMNWEPVFFVWGNEKYISEYSVGFKADGNCEKENNDSIATANSIKMNTEYKGIANEGLFVDEDFFKFTTSRKGDVVFRLRTDMKKNFLAITLVDTKGNLQDIKLGDNIPKKKDYRGDYYEYTLKGLQSGTYVGEVTFLDKEVPYTVSFSQGATNQTKFNDIAGHFAERDIVNFVNKSYTQGYSDGTFRPNKAITRAEFIKFTNKIFGYKNYKNIEKFSDVSSKNWYYNEVNAALNAGYITSGNSKFRPNDPITREEVANIITSIKKCKDSKLDKLNKYSDKNKVSTWAKSSVEGAIEKGYMGQGSKTFRPKDNITRGEAVVTLSRAANNK